MGEISVRSTWGAFTIVPMELLESDLSQSARLVFIALMSHVDHTRDEQRVYPGYEAIMKRSGISGRATISRAIEELEKRGWLHRTKRFSGSTIYTLTRPVVQKLNDSSSEIERMDSAPVVQNLNDSSSNSERHSFKNETLTRINQLDQGNQNQKVPRRASRARVASENPIASIDSVSEEQKPKRAKTSASRAILSIEEQARHRELFDAIAQVCVLDAKMNGGIIARTAKQLRTGDAAAHAADVQAFLEWWKTSDFRGRQGSPPTPFQLIASWKKFRDGYADIPKSADNRQTKKPQITDMLSMLGGIYKEKTNGN